MGAGTGSRPPGAADGPGERRCAAGDWVEVQRILLEPGDRAAGLPPETASKPFVMWVKGFAQDAAVVGEAVTIETMSGRLVSGQLFAVNPGYYQTFGAPIEELASVGRDLRSRVAAYRAEGAAGGAADARPGQPAGDAGGAR